tara:strand:- start:4555 stop:4989 length:435 start_codon:yes stop_codon:yes gene_type:complete
MDRIFGTFDRFVNHKTVARRLVFNNLVNELGDKINGEVYIDNQMVIACLKLKFGDRYLIGFKHIENGVLIDINQTKKLRKVMKCDIFRRFKGEIHFVGGKYQGKKDSDLDEAELSDYCIWLARETYNEITIKTCLQILKKLHDE